MYPLCETCGVLTGLLIAATHKLTVATARMAGLAGTGQHALFKVAEVETRTLQEECGGSTPNWSTQGTASLTLSARLGCLPLR
jgi:hypothetical protein